MASQVGLFVWYELYTTDLDAAAAFYQHVVGWQSHSLPMPGMDYRMFRSRQGNNSGMMILPEEAKAMGAPPHWLGYICVEDVDAAHANATALGARTYAGPMDVPGTGRFVILADPQGATTAFFQPEGTPAAMHDRVQHGEFGWHELMTSDPAAALAFYQQFVPWQEQQQMDMGPDGLYHIFGLGADHMLGGMMRRPQSMPVSAWGYYIGVEDLDAAMGRVQTGGGQVVHGPMEVPGGARVVNCLDPQGAFFSLMG